MKIVTDLSVISAPMRPRQAWHPSRLVGAGNPGALFDAGAAGALWQDIAGTVPAVPDAAVARVDDLSGHGNHLLQATVAARPVLRVDEAEGRYLEFNGVNRKLATSPLAFASHTRLTLAIALLREFSGGSHMPIVYSTDQVAPSFSFWAPPAIGRFTLRARGTGFVDVNHDDAEPGGVDILVGAMDAAAPFIDYRRNGVQVATSVTDPGVETWGERPLNLGSRGGADYFNGRVYAAAVVAGDIAAKDVASLETWMAARTGVAL